MINNVEKLNALLAPVHFADLRKLWINRAMLEAGKYERLSDMLKKEGLVEEVLSDGYLTEDGREVLVVYGKHYALTKEEHSRRKAEAIKIAQGRKHATGATGATCKALIGGQLCGGDCTTQSVCPDSALGKTGVVSISTCDVCGCQLVTIRES